MKDDKNDDVDSVEIRPCSRREVIYTFLMIPIVLMAIMTPPLDVVDNSYNVTELVVYKDIGHARIEFTDNTQYHVYTMNNSFEVDLETYNRVNVNDTVNITYDDWHTPTWHFNNHVFYSQV